MKKLAIGGMLARNSYKKAIPGILPSGQAISFNRDIRPHTCRVLF
jgi:hypothetical protein